MNDNNSTIVYRSQIEKSIDESLYNNSNFMFVYGILSIFFVLFLVLFNKNKTTKNLSAFVQVTSSIILAGISTYLLHLIFHFFLFK